jgi:protein SERAC1
MTAVWRLTTKACKRIAKAHYLRLSFAGRHHREAGKKTTQQSSSRLTLLQALAYSASRTAKNIEHLHSVFVSTYAVLFLGTPHNGSSKAKLAMIGQSMLDALVPSKIWDTNDQLLAALEEGSETLQNTSDQFAPLMKYFCIYFFWEQEKTDLKFKRDYVSVHH